MQPDMNVNLNPIQQGKIEILDAEKGKVKIAGRMYQVELSGNQKPSKEQMVKLSNFAVAMLKAAGEDYIQGLADSGHAATISTGDQATIHYEGADNVSHDWKLLDHINDDGVRNTGLENLARTVNSVVSEIFRQQVDDAEDADEDENAAPPANLRLTPTGGGAEPLGPGATAVPTKAFPPELADDDAKLDWIADNAKDARVKELAEAYSKADTETKADSVKEEIAEYFMELSDENNRPEPMTAAYKEQMAEAFLLNNLAENWGNADAVGGMNVEGADAEGVDEEEEEATGTGALPAAVGTTRSRSKPSHPPPPPGGQALDFAAQLDWYAAKDNTLQPVVDAAKDPSVAGGPGKRAVYEKAYDAFHTADQAYRADTSNADLKYQAKLAYNLAKLLWNQLPTGYKAEGKGGGARVEDHSKDFPRNWVP